MNNKYKLRIQQDKGYFVQEDKGYFELEIIMYLPLSKMSDTSFNPHRDTSSHVFVRRYLLSSAVKWTGVEEIESGGGGTETKLLYMRLSYHLSYT